VIERIQGGGSIPKRCSDIWTEIREWLGRWGDRVDVQWTRGHVEERKKKEDWTHVDWGNYLSDIIAEAMYAEAQYSPDPARKLPCAGRWRLWEKGHPASDKLYDMALQRLAENQIDDYMVKHDTGGVDREHWEFTTVGLGYTGTHAPHLRGKNLQRLFSKNRTQEELRHQGSCGGRSDAVKAAMQQTHCVLCRAQEDTWHTLANCANAQLKGHRRLLWSKYDTAMLQKRKTGEQTHWTAKPSTALRRVVKVRDGVIAAAQRGCEGQLALRHTMHGIATRALMQGLAEAGVTEERMTDTMRKHGEFMGEYFWEGWAIRNKEWGKKQQQRQQQ
jgi:hypothetical protein